MTTLAFLTLLEAARVAHAQSEALQAFCAFPDDLAETPWTPFTVPPAALMAAEAGWGDSAGLSPLFHAFLAAAGEAQWRETYKGTDISPDFMERFGCYCLIGPDAPWTSGQMFAFVVYMPPGLWYPWHQHPAEELYLVLGGSGEFHREGAAPELLRAGQAAFHASGQPHALRTLDEPLMAYVLWRNHFDQPPELTPGRSLAAPGCV